MFEKKKRCGSHPVVSCFFSALRPLIYSDIFSSWTDWKQEWIRVWEYSIMNQYVQVLINYLISHLSWRLIVFVTLCPSSAWPFPQQKCKQIFQVSGFLDNINLRYLDLRIWEVYTAYIYLRSSRRIIKKPNLWYKWQNIGSRLQDDLPNPRQGLQE